MKFLLPIVLLAATVLLVAAGAIVPSKGGIAGVAGETALPGFGQEGRTPQEAVDNLLSAVRRRNWHAAYGQLANAGKVDEDLMRRDWEGRYTSLRSLSQLERWEVQPLHQSGDE